MQEKKDTLLHCPQCGKTRFSQIESGVIEKLLISFNQIVPPKEIEVVYVCINCGFVIKDKDSLQTRFLIIITGNSESYKRQAVISAGYKKVLEENPNQFKDMLFIQDHNTVFVTKDGAKKNFPPHVQIKLDLAVVNTIDCSDGMNYDEVAKAIEEHHKYYQSMQIK